MDFLALTPAQFTVMAQLDRRRRRERDLMLAQLTAVVVNTSMCAPKEPVDAEDFMLREIQEQPKQGPVQSREEVADALRKIMERYMRVPA